MQTEGSEQGRLVAADTRGKHRISAALKRLEKEIHSLEEELEQLENMEAVSGICNVIMNDVERRADALLPTTNGPTDPLWDRWFEGPPDNSNCKCWIL